MWHGRHDKHMAKTPCNFWVANQDSKYQLFKLFSITYPLGIWILILFQITSPLLI